MKNTAAGTKTIRKTTPAITHRKDCPPGQGLCSSLNRHQRYQRKTSKTSAGRTARMCNAQKANFSCPVISTRGSGEPERLAGARSSGVVKGHSFWVDSSAHDNRTRSQPNSRDLSQFCERRREL